MFHSNQTSRPTICGGLKWSNKCPYLLFMSVISKTQHPPRTIKKLDLEAIKPGTIERFFLHVVSDGMGMPVLVPVIVAKGVKEGKTLGLTAAVHGNELNGIPVIQRLFKEIDISRLTGTIIGVPVVNVPSLVRRTRRFLNGKDLNHLMPGEENGDVSQVYAWRLMDRIIKHFDYLIDLHTASFGRVNSYYVRADLENEVTRQMALLQNPQIALHNPPSDGTLRGAAMDLGIHAITMEVGNPHRFQKGMIREGLTGLHNVLHYLEMLPSQIDEGEDDPVICKNSVWIYTDMGGFLSVIPEVATFVKKGELIARIHNIFGDLEREYFAPQDGIVIGKEVNPVNQTGGRLLHLGLL